MTDWANLPAAESFGLDVTVALVDLEAVGELYGLEKLPFPLCRTRPVGSVWLATRDAGPIDDRLKDGDLRGARAWVEALVRSDVCVECRVGYVHDGPADVRVHGLRSGDSGFVVRQHRDRDGVDVVDIHAVSPDSMGAAIADVVRLIGPGAHPRIGVTGCGDRFPDAPELPDEYDDLGFPIHGATPREPMVPIVDGGEVVAFGKVQCPGGPVLRWVQVVGDGDYIYDFGETGYAEALDRRRLSALIDELIAGSVEAPRSAAVE